MARNIKTHTCNDQCKGRSINTLQCYLCGDQFYSKCFGIDTVTLAKINSIDSCLRFVCGLCQSSCSKNKRKSLSTSVNCSSVSTPTISNDKNQIDDNIKKILELLSAQAPSDYSKINTPAPSIGGNTQPSLHIVHKDDYMTKVEYTNLLKLHDNLNGQINSIYEISHKIHETMNVNDSNLKTNAGNTQQNTNTNNRSHQDDLNSIKITIDNIFKSMLKFQSSIEMLHTASAEKKNMQQIIGALEKKHTNTTTKLTNVSLSHSLMENWAFSNDSMNESMGAIGGRPSLMIRQSIDDDIMEVLKNSERITWDTLDLLTKEVNKQNSKLDSILSHIGIKSNTLSSPLVQSIQSSNISIDAPDHSDDVTNNATNDDQMTEQTNISALAGNPFTMNKQKEAIAQSKLQNTNVPETLNKNSKQKSLKTNSSGGWPRNECGSTNVLHTKNSLVDDTTANRTPTISLTENDPNIFSFNENDPQIVTSNVNKLRVSSIENNNSDFRQINDKIDKLYDDLISKLPIRLPMCRNTHLLGSNIASSDPNISRNELESEINHSSQLIRSPFDVDPIERSSSHNDTDTLSNSLLAQELFNGNTNNNDSFPQSSSPELSNVESLTITSSQQPQVEPRNEFHLSNLSLDTTKEIISNYMWTMGIRDISNVKVTPLVPRNRDISTLSYLSFKIDTCDEISSIIQQRDFWPPNSKFKKFVQKKRPSTAEFTTQCSTNFRSRHPQTNINRRSN